MSIAGRESKIKLDRINLKILNTLQHNARITNHALADQVGLSPSPCLERMRKIEQQGLVQQYLAVLDLNKICTTVSVVATVSLRAHEEDDFTRFEQVANTMPQIVECFKVSGAYDYFLRFVCVDLREYHELSDQLIKSSSSIEKFSSHIVLEAVKNFSGYPVQELTQSGFVSS